MSVITKNPTAPNLVNVEIVPTDSVQNLPAVENLTLQDAVNEALAKRPDVAQAKLTINADGINIQATRNALLPNLTASAFVSTVGPGWEPQEYDYDSAGCSSGRHRRRSQPSFTGDLP